MAGHLDGRAAPTRLVGADGARAVAVLIAAVVQVVAGALGGSGRWGEPVGSVADAYPTPLLPGSGAFTIWSLIYVSMLALAVRQVLPGQRQRAVHRRTGWWLAAAGVLNATWIAVFTQRWIVLSEVVIVALLVCLAIAFGRLSASPAQGWGDRALLHGPVALYAGWVSVATVLGAATAGVAAGLDSLGRLGEVLAAITLLATSTVVIWILRQTTAVLPYAAAVAWALAWVAAAAESPLVRVAALVALTVVAVGAALRIPTDGQRARNAWG